MTTDIHKLFRVLRGLLPVALLGIGVSCAKESDLLAAATQGRDDAKAAYESKQAKSADSAAEWAEKAARLATKQLEKDASGPAKQLALSANELARSARKFAELAREEEAVRSRLGSLRLKAYRPVRAATQRTLFAGLALAADRAAGKGFGSLNEAEKSAAKGAREMARLVGHQADEEMPDDWAAIAKHLKSAGDETHTRTALVMALVLTLSQQHTLALGEISQIDMATLPADNRAYFHAMRGVIYSCNGGDHLAVQDLEASDHKDTGSEIAMLLCGYRSYLAAKEGELKKAEAELIRAAKLWPNNPMVIFVASEQLLAAGEYEKAAVSLEGKLAGMEDEWLAKQIKERAREIREKKGEVEPLFGDKKLLRDFILHQIGTLAKESTNRVALQKRLEGLKAAGEQLLSHIPGGKKTEAAEE